MKKSDYYKPEELFPKEAIGKEPNWILKSGISIIALIVIILLFSSLFIKYPDKITSDIVVTSSNPPIRINNLAEGIVKDVYVVNEQIVRNNQLLYYIDDGYTNLDDVKRIKKILSKPFDELINYPFNDENFLLGEMQNSYQEFQNGIIKFNEYLKYNPDVLKIQKVKTLIKKYEDLEKIVGKKIRLQNQKISLEKRKLNRLSTLNEDGIISDQDKELGVISLIEREEDLENLFTEKANISLKISELRKEIIDLNNKYSSIIITYEDEIKNKLLTLSNFINKWEQVHLIKSPANGRVYFLKHDILNVSVNMEIKIIAILRNPNSSSGNQIIGKMYTPLYNSGRIKLGNKVNIYLDNYPYQDNGIIEGNISFMSKIPEKDSYLITVSLPHGVSTSQKEIPFNEELKGKAEILLDDKSLFQRFFEKLFYLKKNEVN